MSSAIPSIEFFQGISEDLSSVSLRRSQHLDWIWQGDLAIPLDKSTGVRKVLMVFESLKALEKFNSFTKGTAKNLILKDLEGDILVKPSSVKFIFDGDLVRKLKRVECKFYIEVETHWQRFSRFMERYAEANGMEYGTKPKK